MHIPDGILSPAVCAATGAVSVFSLGLCLKQLKTTLSDRTIPLTGMTAALIFAGQMVNFPLMVAPVSGHLMGGVLAAVLVGPWAGCLAVTLVLLVQCALFADGGLLALGANVLHMAVIGSLGGYAVYATIRRLLGGTQAATVAATAIASWLTVMAASALFCLEFQLSWPAQQLPGSDFSFASLFTMMVTLHSVIGLGEAVISGAVVGFVLRHRPDLIATPAGATASETSEQPARPRRLFPAAGRAVTAGIIASLAVAAFLAPFASGHPDGLESVAERTTIESLAAEPQVLVLADYEIPAPVASWEAAPLWQRLSVSLAGLLGTGTVLLAAWLLGRGMKPRTEPAGLTHGR